MGAYYIRMTFICENDKNKLESLD